MLTCRPAALVKGRQRCSYCFAKAGTAASSSTPVDSRLRIYTIVRLRWIAVLGQLVAICVVSFGLGFSLPIGMCLIVIALSAWLNVFLAIRYPARHRLSVGSPPRCSPTTSLQLATLLY